MNIGIRLHDVESGDIAHRLAIAKAQGFECAHLALSKCYDYKMTLPELTPGWASQVKREFNKQDMDCAVLGCYLSLADTNYESLERTQKIYKAHLRFASLLGAGVVGTETPAADGRSIEECHTSEALDEFLFGLEPVVKYAEKVGQVLALEPVFKHTMWNPKTTRKVLDSIGSPNLMVIWDPVNMLHESNYENREEIFAESIDLLADDIAMLHIKDFDIVDGKLVSMGAGLGQMNYDTILKFAKEKKPFIHATLEDTKPENAQLCRKFIQERYDAL